MIVSRKAHTVLPFNIGAIVPGRIVKTATYTRNLINEFDKAKIVNSADLPGWCNTLFRIKELSACKSKVILEYDIPGLRAGTVDVEWPVVALNTAFGIRL